MSNKVQKPQNGSMHVSIDTCCLGISGSDGNGLLILDHCTTAKACSCIISYNERNRQYTTPIVIS